MSQTSLAIRSYRLDPGGLVPATKRRFWRQIALIVPLVLVLAAGEMAMMNGAANLMSVAPVVLPIALAAMAIGLFRGYRTALKNGKPGWDSYVLTVSENVLRRQSSGLPSVEILRPQVARIVETGEDGLTVFTADRHLFLFVPRQLVGYDEVRGHLARWRSFEPAGARKRVLTGAWLVITLGSWLGTCALSDRRLATVSAVVLVAMGLLMIRETLGSRVASSKIKAANIGGLVILMLPVARVVALFAFPRILTP